MLNIPWISFLSGTFCSDDDLPPDRRQDIIWRNDSVICGRIYNSLGLDKSIIVVYLTFALYPFIYFCHFANVVPNCHFDYSFAAY